MVHWTQRRKAALVQAVRDGEITLEEARLRYEISTKEFQSWVKAIDEHGTAGSRVSCAPGRVEIEIVASHHQDFIRRHPNETLRRADRPPAEVCKKPRISQGITASQLIALRRETSTTSDKERIVNDTQT